MRPRFLPLLPVAIALAAAPTWSQQQSDAWEPRKIDIPFRDARATLDLLGESLPPELRGLDVGALERAWPQWVRRSDAETRARLARGDEDSIVNLWLYGTTFTERPRAVERDLSQLTNGASPADIIAGRLDDLIDGMANAGDNERLQFARDSFARRGMDPARPENRVRIRRTLVAARQRAVDEFEQYRREIDDVQGKDDPGAFLSTHGTLFHDRGLSSDTSILASFAVEQALRGMVATGTLGPATVRHVGIVGPGLDYINKADGHDFYPQQTIQPFALIDSLLRVGLADPKRLRVTTFDLSPRVNAHLERARAAADAGHGYALHVPLNPLERWRPDVLDYWRTFGDRIAENTTPAPARGPADGILVRAVRVRPSHVLSVEPLDLNIVVERLSPMAADDRLDLLVATNVLPYYDRFEQSLALTNAAAMLRPGGVFLANSAVFPIPPMKPTAHYQFVEYSDRQNDHVFWYQRE